MGDLLDKLEKENKQETKQIKLQNPDLTDYLLQNLEEIFKFACRHNPLKDDIPGEISRKTSSIYASAKDIESLCSKIKDFENKANFAMWAGMYINDLINNSKDNEFVLQIGHLDKRIEFIGAYNKGKNIQVIGNLGNEI